MNLNKIQLIGELANDPVTIGLPSGQWWTEFRLTTNASPNGDSKSPRRPKAVCHSIVAYGRLARVASKYLREGDRVYLDGSLTERTWRDENDKNCSRTEVEMHNLIMLGGGKKAESRKR